MPESEAPDLMAPLTDDNYDTYFIRQPKTQEEIEQAIGATEVCCVDAVRYGGQDKKILRRLGPSICDYLISPNGEVVLNDCEVTSNTYEIISSYKQYIVVDKKRWWMFWK